MRRYLLPRRHGLETSVLVFLHSRHLIPQKAPLHRRKCVMLHKTLMSDNKKAGRSTAASALTASFALLFFFLFLRKLHRLNNQLSSLDNIRVSNAFPSKRCAHGYHGKGWKTQMLSRFHLSNSNFKGTILFISPKILKNEERK